MCVYDCVVFQRQVQLEKPPYLSLSVLAECQWDDGWCLHRWPILWSCGLSAGLKNKITFNGHSLSSRINCRLNTYSCALHGVQQNQFCVQCLKKWLRNTQLNKIAHNFHDKVLKWISFLWTDEEYILDCQLNLIRGIYWSIGYLSIDSYSFVYVCRKW